MVIRFGTDGWRGIIAEDFTFANLRRAAQGLAVWARQNAPPGCWVVGYDCRFASEDFADACAEVLAGNGLPVLLCDRPAPTPVVAWNIVAHRCAGGVIITASHNPARWNGFKVKTPHGSSAPPEQVAQLEDRINRLGAEEVLRLPKPQAVAQGMVRPLHPNPSYDQQLARLVDLPLLRAAGFTVVVDAMHGAGAGYVPRLLAGGATRVVEIRAERNPLFPGMHNPEPIPHNLAPLVEAVRSHAAQVGLAFDGDADRLGVVDEQGGFLTTLDAFALLAFFLLEVRGQRGPLVKTLTSSRMLLRLGERYGVPVYETPVGFKYVAPLMMEHNALIGGEESGGYAFQGHIPERDGILSGLLLLEFMARTGKTLSDLLRLLHQVVGPHFYARRDFPFPPDQREAIRQRLHSARPPTLAGLPVRTMDTTDGWRWVLEGQWWLAVRFSGTEPLLRIYAEADSPERVQALLDAGQALAGVG
ncbi:MAG: phosphoglucomutase/phosphomannomutase family protein [Dehalococcoidia bacterium]|nr:phosphoglucomutase/phosphomannomutase family protein [Dehalococcoidia bacterium]MDW8119605.1 phosphoglucomutase/phosphomannomutase family protein [Chloroflexota bacterium]